MFSNTLTVYLVPLGVFATIFALSRYLQQNLNSKRNRVMNRLQSRYFTSASINFEEEDVLNQPFLKRTVGYLLGRLASSLSDITPARIQQTYERKLEKAGNPRNMKPGELLAWQSIIALVAMVVSYIIFIKIGYPHFSAATLALVMTILVAYLPLFFLSVMTTQRQSEIRRRLPEMMDMMVISVEAGMAFDIALSRIVEKYPGAISEEFKQALREMNLGKARKDALKDLASRVDLPELSGLVNAVIQSEQLGVGLGGVLRLQADLIRDRRQQWIEEMAMKAPVKMLFPIAFLIFPAIFIVLLGPAFLSIRKVMGM